MSLIYVAFFIISCVLLAGVIKHFFIVLGVRFAWVLIGKKYKSCKMLKRGEVVKINGIPVELLRDVPVYTESEIERPNLSGGTKPVRVNNVNDFTR